MPKVRLHRRDIDSLADEILCILRDAPLFYCEEILELALDWRKREGENPDLDISDSDDDDS